MQKSHQNATAPPKAPTNKSNCPIPPSQQKYCKLHLAEKSLLTKTYMLLQDDMMDIDTNEQKKWTCKVIRNASPTSLANS